MAKTFYLFLAAGVAFMAIGIASVVYANIPVNVALDNKVGPDLTDVMTPDMEAGNTASIRVTGSKFDVKIFDPNRQLLKSEGNATDFAYNFTAQKAGVHTIEVKNTGKGELDITGHAMTKQGFVGQAAAMFLVVTGIIVVGVSLRFKKR